MLSNPNNHRDIEPQFKQDVSLYRRGWHQTIIMAAVIIPSVLLLSWITAYTEIYQLHPLGAVCMAVAIWLAAAAISPASRFFISTLPSMKNKEAAHINQVFYQTGAGWTFHNRHPYLLTTKDIKALNVFERMNSNLRSEAYNAIKGVNNYGQAFTMHNVVIAPNHDTMAPAKLIFQGAVYVTELPVDPSYYLTVKPKVFRKRRMMAFNFRRNNHDSKQDKEKNPMNGYVIDTNDTNLTKTILDEDMQKLFRYLVDDKGCNERRNQPEKPAKHSIKALVVQNKKLYVFFPYQNETQGKHHLFDVLRHGRIEPAHINEDIQAVYAKHDIINHVIEKTESVNLSN